MKRLITLVALISTTPIWAVDFVDVFGVNSDLSTKIEQKYGQRVQVLASKMQAAFLAAETKPSNSNQLQELYVQKNNLINEIKHDGHFASVDLQTVQYPSENANYTTIEIVTQEQPERLRFISKTTPSNPLPNQHDIIQQMIEYQALAMDLILQNSPELKLKDCPVYHCTASFNHSKLKPYLAVFNKGVKQYKDKIIDTLNQDPDPSRRTAAAFLIGHFKNPHDIISLLSPHINDQSEEVRNGVMRVIALTSLKAHITDLDALPFLKLLDSPMVTDRNKALAVLFTIADSRVGKQQILTHDQGRLEALSRLKQPNNHDIAVQILKKINPTEKTA